MSEPAETTTDGPRSRTRQPPKKKKLNMRLSETHSERLIAVCEKLVIGRSEWTRRKIDEDYERMFPEGH